jgi:hypothetical protein
MSRTLLAVAAMALAAGASAYAGDFQIKGRSLGLPEDAACQGSEIESHQKLLEAAGLTGYEFPATACRPKVDSVAGVAPSGPARLLFWRGKLIRVIVEFDGLNTSEAGAFSDAFKDLYGKPAMKRNPPFTTHTWRSGHQTLQLEWTVGVPLSVGVYLTDDAGWKEYERSRDKADKAVNTLSRQRRSADVRG